MPRGPNGERRPADVIGAAIMVGKIATGEIEEAPIRKDGRVRSGEAGAAARARNLPPQQRREIARKAASVRWRKGGGTDEAERVMGQKLSERKGFSKPKDNAARMYPNNGLGEPVHDYDTTFSAVTLMKEVFFQTDGQNK